jgi:hypothetical protein
MSAKKSAVNTGFLSYRGFLRFPDNLGPFWSQIRLLMAYNSLWTLIFGLPVIIIFSESWMV